VKRAKPMIYILEDIKRIGFGRLSTAIKTLH
jgi:hypothetical protein